MLIFGVLILVSFLFYKSSLQYYFVSDDFFILFYHKIHTNLVAIDQFNNHYTPVIWLFISQLYNIFGLNSFAFHMAAILVHLSNIFLVYLLTNILTKNKVKSILSSLLFAFFFGAYEVVYWFGAVNNSLMVTFYILSLIFLIKYVKKTKFFSFLLFQIGFLAAYFTHEYAISLIPTGVAYWWLFSTHKKRGDFIKLFSIPIFIVFASSLLKALFVHMPLVVRTPSIIKFFAFCARSFVYLFIPNPYIVDRIPNIIIPLIFIILFILIYKLTRKKITIFLLIWTTTTICVYSLTSAPQARYFYLSFIPVAIYILSIVELKKIIAIFYLSFILVSGIVFLQDQKYYWRQSSDITKNVIKNITKYYPQQKTDVVYFVNLPDSSNNSIWKAYVFRFGFKELLENVIHIYPKKIVFITSYAPTPHTIQAPYVNPNKLKVLMNKNTLIFVYQEDTKSVLLFK